MSELHFVTLSPFPLNFLIFSPFPLHFLILSPFPCSPAARLQQLLQPCGTTEDALKSKSWRKQTRFKIKFHIRIQVGRTQFWNLGSQCHSHRALIYRLKCWKAISGIGFWMGWMNGPLTTPLLRAPLCSANNIPWRVCNGLPQVGQSLSCWWQKALGSGRCGSSSHLHLDIRRFHTCRPPELLGWNYHCGTDWLVCSCVTNGI